MLRSQSKCTQNVIGEYIGRKMIQSPQFTQDVPTGFQVTSPPVLSNDSGMTVPIFGQFVRVRSEHLNGLARSAVSRSFLEIPHHADPSGSAIKPIVVDL